MVTAHFVDRKATEELEIIETTGQFQEHHKLMLARSLVHLNRKQVPLRLLNKTDSTKTVYKDSIAATCEPAQCIDQDNFLGVNCVKSRAIDSEASLETIPDHLTDVYTRSCQNLDEKQQRDVSSLLKDFSDVFSSTTEDIGRTNIVTHRINTGDSLPIKQQARRLPLHKRQEAQKEDLCKEKRADEAIGTIIQLKEKNESRPNWCGISSKNPSVKSYWAQWDRLLLKDSVLYRQWESDTQDISLQLVLPPPYRQEVLKHLHNTLFISVLRRHLKKLKTAFTGQDKTRTTPLRPQSDGMVERLNRTLKNMLSKFVKDNVSDWDCHLPLLMMAYRSSVHETTGCSPSELMFGREIRLPVDLMFGAPESGKDLTNTCDYARSLQDKIRKVHGYAREHLTTESDRQKKKYNQRLNQKNYDRGAPVWFYNPKRRKGVSPCLQLPWEGPYLVLKRISDVVYKIQKSPRSKSRIIHHDRLQSYLKEKAPTWLYDVEEVQPVPADSHGRPSKKTSDECQDRPETTEPSLAIMNYKPSVLKATDIQSYITTIKEQ
ncbi:Retrovirus-related Pol polyprotein from transposon 412 [Exaiptasia diaphana]|nr:Retrovirus-related Pol polyprotein from transposon 412 [Exaiptasia diaphana]